MDDIILYGVPHSMFTGRARSYLLKAGIPFRERAPRSDHYLKTVVPSSGRNTMPTIEFPDGRVIRDGAAIIEHFEDLLGQPFTPSAPKQRAISLLFDAIGSEGLYRPALHYRWSFASQTPEFFRYHFETMVGSGEDRAGLVDFIFEAMTKSTARIGVTQETIPVVESVYKDQLAALDQHFSAHGYLLGARPSLGDFGLISPMFGHLSRDPAAHPIMLALGARVFRWVERMNRPSSDLAEFDDPEPEWLPNDGIPETLIGVLQAFAEDFMPETLAASQAINAWLDEQDQLEPGSACPRSAGMAHFTLRGVEFSAVAQPYRFYLLARFQEAYRALDPADRGALDGLLEASGMSEIVDVKLSRSVEWKDNLEVWA